jgi:hypothetical protein
MGEVGMSSVVIGEVTMLHHDRDDGREIFDEYINDASTRVFTFRSLRSRSNDANLDLAWEESFADDQIITSVHHCHNVTLKEHGNEESK